MHAVESLEMSAKTNTVTWCHITEDLHPQQHSCGVLICWMKIFYHFPKCRETFSSPHGLTNAQNSINKILRITIIYAMRNNESYYQTSIQIKILFSTQDLWKERHMTQIKNTLLALIKLISNNSAHKFSLPVSKLYNLVWNESLAQHINMLCTSACSMN